MNAAASTRRSRSSRGYSLLTVLMLLTLLGIAVSGLLFFITQSVHTSGSMIERRRTFYVCDGMSRQLIAFTQAFLAENTLEDVPESQLQASLRARLPAIVPPDFVVGPNDLIVPEKALPNPVPVETITNGPFAGLQAKIQTIDIALQAKKTRTGAVCRTEQSMSLGKIALFQFFVFADQPILDLVPPNGEAMFMRGRIHTNGRVCMAGNEIGLGGERFAVRLDSRVTAVERIFHAGLGPCGFQENGNVGIINGRAPGEQVPGEQDRLGFPALFDPLVNIESSGCQQNGDGSVCAGGWRSYAITHWIGRVQDIDHTVSELTLPVSPPANHVQLGVAANGGLVQQRMNIGPPRPNTRFLVEPQLTNDPTGFGRNKMAFKAQIRIIDGVWYVKDPGRNNDPLEIEDDGPWPGIPIWSDHPGEFTTAIPSVTTEGVEGAVAMEVGQADIRKDIAARAEDDTRLRDAVWDRRFSINNVPPTPRRFSYYAFVDRSQAKEDQESRRVLRPAGMGLQYGRVCTRIATEDGFVEGPCDADPPAVISYGAISPVTLSAPQDNQVYWQPGFRALSSDFNERKHKKTTNQTGWCGGHTDRGTVNEVRDSLTLPAAFMPATGQTESGDVILANFPVPGTPLPSTSGNSVSYAGGSANASSIMPGRTCQSDSEDDVRRRARLALLEGTRTGFIDTHAADNRARLRPNAQPNVLPVNFDIHAFQEALADKTPGELGSYFCDGCLWEEFNGSLFITNTWRGSQLGASTFPDGEASPPPNPVVNDGTQPKAVREGRSTTDPLPFTLCAANSDEDDTAHAQVVGHRFVEMDDERNGFTLPYDQNTKPLTAFGRLGPFEMLHDRPTNPTTMTPPEAATSLPSSVTNAALAFNGSFVIPNCRRYALAPTPAPLAAARPTALRVINARVVNFNAEKCGRGQAQACLPRLSGNAEGQLSQGFNLITNVPAYVTGDVNQTSEVNNVQTGGRADDWIPFMIAADTLTTLSNSWDDEASRWGVSADDFALDVGGTIRPASNTRYHMLVLTGVNAAGAFQPNGQIVQLGVGSGGGLPNVMRLMENWSAERNTHTFRGAIVIGWSPVYTQWKVGPVSRGTYAPPLLRDWQFDRHLNATINQPPDSPVFDVSAIRSWRRE